MPFLPYPPNGTTEAVNVLNQDVQILHNIVHGSELVDIPTENGDVPTIAKLIKEVEDATGVDVSLRSDLAAVNSTVLVGGVPASSIGQKCNQFITPEDFNAVGDGMANDTSAVESFLNAVADGNIACVQSGKIYLVDRTIVVNITNQKLSVDFNSSTLKAKATFVLPDAENPIIKIRGTGEVNICNLVIDGNNNNIGLLADNEGMNALDIRGTDSSNKLSKVTIDNCRAFETGADFITVFDCEMLNVTNSRVYRTFGHGISFKRCTNVVIENNKIDGIGASGGNIVTGIKAGIGILGGMSSKIVISGNHINNMTDTGSKCEGCQDVTYYGNVVTNVGKDGIKVQGHPEQTTTPDRVSITDNIIRNLYDWRTDGSNCIGIHDARYVTITGNKCSSDPAVTGATIAKRGVTLLNFNSGAQGSAGFIVVSNNIIEKCAVHDDTDWINKYSIHVQRNGSSSGQMMTVANNICYSFIVAGGGFGSTVVTGNTVGASPEYDGMLFNTDASGIILRGAYCVATGNSIKGFPVGVTYLNFTPYPDVANVAVTGNSFAYITKAVADFGSQANGVYDIIKANVTFSGNVCSRLGIGNDAAIWIRSGQVEFNTVNICNNTFDGDYRTLLSLKSYTSGHVHKQYSVSENSENSSRTDYFDVQLIPYCLRVLGDYAKHSSAPTSDKKYRRGDVVWNSIVQGDRPSGWICIEPTAQTWMKFANPTTI
jgi:hypothetical protein